jgi:alpha-beta hydrolase superfamily lysophospholipase
MRKLDIRVDVTEAVGTGEALELAMTVVLPPTDAPPPTTAMFAFPGGGYCRSYYDLPLEGGYSQAEYHAEQGFVFVACDHLGVGGSSVPTRNLDYVAVARANAAASSWVIGALRAGTLVSSVRAPITATVGMGQSFGGFILTIGEGRSPVFDGVALLGWSGIETIPPWPADVDLAAIAAGTAGNGLDHPMRRVFHATDVPDEIVIADMTKRPGNMGSSAPWSTAYSPGGPSLVDNTRGPLGPGVVAVEAAAIATPVFIAAGDIDVVADPLAEPSAYRSSRDVTVCVFPHMAHMHNFATTRTALWDRLAAWASIVAATKP